MSLSVNIGRPFLNDKTLDEQARSILRKYGTDAHVYLPGASGVRVSALNTNNYTLSDGSTGYSAVDGTAGLVLDGAGSLQATELNIPANWGAPPAGVTKDATLGTVTFSGAQAAFSSVNLGTVCVTDVTYAVTFTVTGAATAVVRVDATYPTYYTAGTYTTYQKANGVSNGRIICSTTAAGGVSNISIREVTGIHATQSTTANKPALRRGLYNLLTYSNDLSNAAWVAENTCSKSGSNILTPAVGDDVYHGTTVAAGSYTLAAQLSGTGTCSLFAYNATNGIHGVTQITLTSTPTIFVSGITSTVANTAYYIGRKTGDTATSITFGGAGLFTGTLTAAQILSEGGIPLTLASAASNSGAGRYSWQFDGSNDSLALGSVPFQMSDDHCVIAGARADVVTGDVLSVSSTASSMPMVGRIVISSGSVIGYWRDDAGTVSQSIAGNVSAGAAFVASAVSVSSNRKARLNGSNGATSSTALSTATLNTAVIGARPPASPASYFNGSVGPIILIKGAVSDADLLTLERWVAANTPAAPTF